MTVGGGGIGKAIAEGRNTMNTNTNASVAVDDVRARTGSEDLYAVSEVSVRSQSAICTLHRSTESSRADEYVGTDKPSWIDTAITNLRRKGKHPTSTEYLTKQFPSLVSDQIKRVWPLIWRETLSERQFICKLHRILEIDRERHLFELQTHGLGQKNQLHRLRLLRR